jgi:basic membrane protein A
MKSPKKVFFLVTIFIVLGLVFSACTPKTTATEETAPENATLIGAGHNVAVVFASSGLGDKSFNDSLFTGMVLASSRLGFAWDYVEPTTMSELEPYLRSYAQSGTYDLIVCNGFSCGSSLTTVATEFPNQKFMINDAFVDLPNVASYSFKVTELSYLVGVVAGKLTKTNTIGFIAAHDIPLLNEGLFGYRAGAESVNPDVEVVFDYVGSWDDITKTKEIALALYSQGADFFYHNASLGGLGMIEAGKEKGFFTVGFDGNQNPLAPATNILSAIRSFPEAVGVCIEGVLKGEFSAGNHLLGIKDDGEYITNDLSTYTISPEIWALVDEAKQGIIDGTIVMPAVPGE